MKILLIEDCERTAEFIKLNLSKMFADIDGIEIKQCSRFIECEAIAGDYNPDIVLFDLLIPPYTAGESLEKIREFANLGYEVVVCSGISDEELYERCFQAGAHDFIPKSLVFDQSEDGQFGITRLAGRLIAAYYRGKYGKQKNTT